MTAQRWGFRYSFEPSLPPLAWLARIEHGSDAVSVSLGNSVRRDESAFFDGTWVGDAGLTSIQASTTAFGSGMVVGDDGLLVITPTHAMSGVYAVRTADELVVSNSLTALLAATNAELKRDADYSSPMFLTIEGVHNSPIKLPTSNGTVEHHVLLEPACRGRRNAQPRPATA